MWELDNTNDKLDMDCLRDDLGTRVPCLPHHEGPSSYIRDTKPHEILRRILQPFKLVTNC